MWCQELGVYGPTTAGPVGGSGMEKDSRPHEILRIIMWLIDILVDLL